MDISVLERDRADRLCIENYVCLGYNYRMTDIQAAVGIEQMKKLNWILERRRRLAAQYAESLADIPWLCPPYVPDYAEPNFQSYAVQLREGVPVARDDVIQRLLERGVSTRRGVMLAHREPAYAANGGRDARRRRREHTARQPGGRARRPRRNHGDQTNPTCSALRNSELASANSLLLPMFPQMTDEQQDTVLTALSSLV
jgi:dTDP-4-amino-4,6-dideoxygalactose transaminase